MPATTLERPVTTTPLVTRTDYPRATVWTENGWLVSTFEIDWSQFDM